MSETTETPVDAAVAPVSETPVDAPAEALQPPQDAAAPVASAPDAAPVATPQESVTLTLGEVERRIQHWISLHIMNSAVAQSTEAWNHLTASVGHLRDIIMREI